MLNAMTHGARNRRRNHARAAAAAVLATAVVALGLTATATATAATGDARVMLSPRYVNAPAGATASSTWTVTNAHDQSDNPVTTVTPGGLASAQTTSTEYVTPGQSVTYTITSSTPSAYNYIGVQDIQCEYYPADGGPVQRFDAEVTATSITIPSQYVVSDAQTRCSPRMAGADPWVNKRVRLDDGTGEPTAASVFSVSGRTTTPYRQFGIASGTVVQYDLAISDRYNSFGPTAGITVNDVVPTELTDVSVVGIYDRQWADSTCSDATYDAGTGTVSGTVGYALGETCHIVIQGTMPDSTPFAGFDNRAQITVPGGVDNVATANDVSGQNVAAFDPAAISCTADAVYGLGGAGSNALYLINTTDRSMTVTGNFPSSNTLNALAIGPARDKFWAVDQTLAVAGGPIQVHSWNPVTGVMESFATDLTAPQASGLVGGAVRSDGVYFMQAQHFDATGNRIIDLYAFNTVTNTWIGKVAEAPLTLGAGATAANTGNNGDITFDTNGNLYYTTETDATGFNAMLAMWEGPIPATAGANVLAPSVIVTLMSTSTSNNGTTMTANGMLYVNGVPTAGSTQGQLSEIDPNTGEVQWSQAAQLPAGRTMNDLASCSYPATIRVAKVFDGRTVPTDDALVSISRDGVEIAAAQTGDGVGTGADTAESSEVIAAVGVDYTFRETGIAATDIASYTTTYQCVNTLQNNAVVASGTGTTFTLTGALPLVPTAILCTFTNTEASRVVTPPTDPNPPTDPAPPASGAGGAQTGSDALATTGGTVAVWVIVGGFALFVSGALLLYVRRSARRDRTG